MADYDDAPHPGHEQDIHVMHLGFVEMEQSSADPIFGNLLERLSIKTSQLTMICSDCGLLILLLGQVHQIFLFLLSGLHSSLQLL